VMRPTHVLSDPEAEDERESRIELLRRRGSGSGVSDERLEATPIGWRMSRRKHEDA
jgi:hypothetical protein